jgi:hypothetical protein
MVISQFHIILTCFIFFWFVVTCLGSGARSGLKKSYFCHIPGHIIYTLFHYSGWLRVQWPTNWDASIGIFLWQLVPTNRYLSISVSILIWKKYDQEYDKIWFRGPGSGSGSQTCENIQDNMSKVWKLCGICKSRYFHSFFIWFSYYVSDWLRVQWPTKHGQSGCEYWNIPVATCTHMLHPCGTVTLVWVSRFVGIFTGCRLCRGAPKP